jgi:integrase
MGRDRIHGPYKHRSKWRVIEVGADGTRQVVSFESAAEAEAYIAAAKRVAIGHSVGQSVTAYLEHLREAPGKGGIRRRGSTIKLADWRLSAFLRLPSEDRPLAAVSKQHARKLFDLRAGEVKPDTLQGELATVQRWARFCKEEGWLVTTPFDGLVVMGERSAGKPQLRIDEARKFLGSALGEQSLGGLAAALALLTGMRASEVTGVVVRDLDDDGRVLWVADNNVRRLKTRKTRRLEVPVLLIDELNSLTIGKGPEDPLFSDGGKPLDRHWLYHHVVRLCQKAGVPPVSPHGLRGTWATIARGVLPTDAVAATIGNLPQVSARSYIAPGAAESADAARVVGDLLPAAAVSDEASKRETVVVEKFPGDAQLAERDLN